MQFAQRLTRVCFGIGAVNCLTVLVNKALINCSELDFEAQIEYDLASRANVWLRGLGQQKYF